MGDGTRENPLTREDVLKMIEENGGKAEGLDLSGKVFERGVNLSGLDLKGIRLSQASLEEANLVATNLHKTDLTFASLEGANLEKANLEDAFLAWANLNGAILVGARFERTWLDNTNLIGTFLSGVDFSPETYWGNVGWGNYCLGEENKRFFYLAEVIYRKLKIWHNQAGYSDTAAKFYYREKEASRKAAKRRRDRIAGWLSWAFFGHGEGWKRILFWIAGFVLFFALIYFIIGTLTPNDFLNSLYYSAVSFIALGYGGWVKESTGWVKGLGVCETFLGFFMMTLLLVTFVRKWTR